MMEFDRERAGPLPERTNAQKHKRTKTQKHKSTKAQKHKNTETQYIRGPPYSSFIAPFIANTWTSWKHVMGNPGTDCWPLQSFKLFSSIVIRFWSFWLLQSFFQSVDIVVFGVWGYSISGEKHKRTETQTHRRTDTQTHTRTNAHSHTRKDTHTNTHKPVGVPARFVRMYLTVIVSSTEKTNSKDFT